MLKPRLEAGTIGIKKFGDEDELWPLIDALGDRASFHLLEQFVPGDVFHVDCIVYEREVLAAVAALRPPPFDVCTAVASSRRSWSSAAAPRTGAAGRQPRRADRARAGARRVAHRVHPRRRRPVYFLETSARVGGAHIAELVEAATGMNLWAEWAKVELAGGNAYAPPPLRPTTPG